MLEPIVDPAVARVAIEEVPCQGEMVSGDQARCWPLPGRLLLCCMIDGLGHGPAANEASMAAVSWLDENHSRDLGAMLDGCYKALRHTRGAAIGLALVDAERGQLEYAAIGNTRCRVMGALALYLPAQPGIVGAGRVEALVSRVQIGCGTTVILSTDGIAESPDLSSYGDAILQQPGALARRLIQDHGRADDDRCVLVVRLPDGE